ncbi:MAG: hypothetical protein LQ352_003955 [Teloschistes flavicans]|nr:MAG: hypothetical protein LQ352_003955 [Teloschistes flavicans]
MKCQQFFQLEPTTKASINVHKGPRPQRGYGGVGGESFKHLGLDGTGDDYVDVKEHFDQGPRNDIDFPNQWPPETASNNLIGFRSFMEDYFDSMSTLAHQLLSSLEVALELVPGTLTLRCSQNHSELRLNHYPPTTIEEIKNGSVRRVGAHTDYGVLTLLFQDRNGGLEVQDRSVPAPDLKFVPVTADDPYELVVNVADTLQRWTNDLIPAGLHQVTIPAGRRHETVGRLHDRFSIAYFVKSNREESVGSLSDFVSEDRSARYESISAIDYHERKHTVLYT